MGKSVLQNIDGPENEKPECPIGGMKEEERSDLRSKEDEKGSLKLDCHAKEDKLHGMGSLGWKADDGSIPLEGKIDQERYAHHSPMSNDRTSRSDETSLDCAKEDSSNGRTEDLGKIDTASSHGGINWGNQQLTILQLSSSANDQTLQLPCVKRMNRMLSRVLEESESFMKREFGSAALEATSYMNCRGNGWKSMPPSSSSTAMGSRSLPRMAMLLLLRRGMSDGGATLHENSSRNSKKKKNKTQRGSEGNGELCKKKPGGSGHMSKRRAATISLGGFLWPLKKVRDSYVSWMMGFEASTNIYTIAN